MKLPDDPVILLSVINTFLRDKYTDLKTLCDDYNIKQEDVIDKLSLIGYSYNKSQNQFK